MKTQHLDLTAAHAATVASLTEFTADPIDAMRLASDLYAMGAYRAERAAAIESGGPSPHAPRPRSKYLRAFAAGLRTKLAAILGQVTVDELERIKLVAPALLQWLADNELEAVDAFTALVAKTPADAAAWVRGHLDEIEARFAS